MSVHYKFKSALEYDTVIFDGLHISVKDLKNSIVQQKRIGKNTDFDLQVTNAQTKEIYDDDQVLIPKNTSLLIARIPLAVQNKGKSWEGYGGDSAPVARLDEGGPAGKAVDLSNLDASEDDKIRAMMSQSTHDYDPSNYMKIRGSNQVGVVPPNYRCYKCHQSGHWIKDCPLGLGTEQTEIKKSTGIPRSFMVAVDGPGVQGAMMTPNGSYAVPVLDHQTYTQKPGPVPAPTVAQKVEIPEDLVCSICTDLLTDAVMIPCCGNSFCDECIRSSLLESEDHECPDCHERDISPGTLIPNRFLRNSVLNFKNTTGYVKRQVYKPSIVIEKPILTDAIDLVSKPEDAGSEVAAATDPNTEKTIISEADSTEAPKTPVSDGTNKDIVAPKTDEVEPPKELPPGVSPVRDTTAAESRAVNVNTTTANSNSQRAPAINSKYQKINDNRASPRKVQKTPAPYKETVNEERPGTPTVDEPGMGGANNGDNPPPLNYQTPNAPYPSGPPVMSGNGAPSQHQQQGPPMHLQQQGPHPGMNQSPVPQYPNQPQHPPGQYQPNPGMPPHGGPLPNFRLPPPGQAPPNFMQQGYNAPPRPMFDGNAIRPHMLNQGPPPVYQNYSTRQRGVIRDFPPNPNRPNLTARTPPCIIDDPLEAFNRMLREKDERDRRAKARKGRSYSRSSSRSYSRSPRRRSRSPRRRSRSRSKSFSISRSRSRSYSPLNRGSPYRDYSPRRQRPPSRYRSPPPRSPPRYRYKDGGPPADRVRDRGDYDRGERDREREYVPPQNKRDLGRGYSRDRTQQDRAGGGAVGGGQEFHYYDNFERDNRGQSQRGGAGNKWANPSVTRDYYPPDGGYHQNVNPQAHGHPVSNRYPPRDQYQNHQVYKTDHIPSLLGQNSLVSRRYDDVAPPGTEQPLPPGEEPETRYPPYERNAEIAPDRYNVEHDKFNKDNDKYNREDRFPQENRDKREDVRDNRDFRDTRETRESRDNRDRDRRHHSRSPKRAASTNHSKDRNDSPDKHRRKKRDDSPARKEADKDKKKEHSDDEKARKNKDKKKKREKKDAEKKKKKEKKEKREHKKEEKEKARLGKEKKEDKEGEVANIEKPVKEDEAVDKGDLAETVAQEIMQEVVQVALEEELSSTPKRESTPKNDLYDDVLTDGIDNSIVESYGKLNDSFNSTKTPELRTHSPELRRNFDNRRERGEHESKEYEDILELHTGELKTELDMDVLAPIPEKSKWELDDELSSTNLEVENDNKSENSKVTNEVLKRAENAIFAKAINAIRPIEIKKISSDRVKLYSGERDDKHYDDVKIIEPVPNVTYDFEEEMVIPDDMDQCVKIIEEPIIKPVRLSVKERLGCKVDELDRIVHVEKLDRNRSRTLSPFARRSQDMRGDRRVESSDNKRHHHRSDRDRERNERDRHHRNYRDGGRGVEVIRREDNILRRDDGPRRDHRDDNRRRDDRRTHANRDDKGRVRDVRERRERDRSKSRHRREEEAKRDKRKRSRSKSENKEKLKKRDKKVKKEKPKKHHKKEDEVTEKEETKSETKEKPKTATDKRKPTLDEANFEPDYDLESEDDDKSKKRVSETPQSDSNKKRAKLEEKKESSSSESSSSSSDDDKKKKKHKKHRKKKRKDSSSSSSDSDSSSSDEDKDRKKKKHKKKTKKKKKSKHK